MQRGNSHFLSLLRTQAGTEGQKLVLACCGAGIAQGVTVFSVLSGLEQLSGDGVQFQTFLLFLLSLFVFFRLFHYTAERGALLALQGIMEWRIRLAAKLRGLRMEQFELIPRERIQALLLDEQEMVVETARMLMAAAANSIMVAVALVRMFLTSFWGTCGVLVLMGIGLCIWFKIIGSIGGLMVPAKKAEMEFSSNLRDLEDGFQHLKVHIQKTIDLFTRWLLPGLERSCSARSAMERRHALGISFFASLNLLMLGMLLFLLPRLLPVDAKSTTTLLVLVMFCLSPLMSLITLVPMLTKVEMGLGELTKLEKELDASIEPCESSYVQDLWDSAAPDCPAFESLKMSNIRFDHKDAAGTPVFSINISEFTLKRGEIVFLRGGNGAGKTTFLRIFTGLYIPNSGEITLNGRPLSDIGLEVYRNMFSIVPSDFHLFQHPLGLRKSTEEIREILRLNRLENKVTVLEDGGFSTRDLSAGQKKRLALTCALLEDREIFLFDEVAADFDPEFRRFFYESLLPLLRSKGKTIVAISHDDRYFSCADRVLHMADGSFVQDAAQL